MTSIPCSESEVVRSVERLRHERRAKREPIGLTSVVALCTAGLGIAVLGVEWKNLDLALFELFPPTSDGSGYSISGPIAAASMVTIMLGDVLLDKASEHWSERTHRWLDLAGIASLALFVVSAMVLLPASIVQANDVMDATGDGGGASSRAFLAFACMLGAWFPMSLLGNFVLFKKLKPALQRIERTWLHDRWQRRIGAKLGEYVELSGALRQVEHERDNIPDDAEVTRQAAADISATIGEVESELSGVILRRKAAETAHPDAPLAASGNEYFNVAPAEALFAHREYLRGFSPEAVENTLTAKGA